MVIPYPIYIHIEGREGYPRPTFHLLDTFLMQVNFPMCTLADIPRTPAHCVEWAKQLEWDRYEKACAPPALELALLLQIPLAYQPFMLQEKELSGAIETEG